MHARNHHRSRAREEGVWGIGGEILRREIYRFDQVDDDFFQKMKKWGLAVSKKESVIAPQRSGRKTSSFGRSQRRREKNTPERQQREEERVEAGFSAGGDSASATQGRRPPSEARKARCRVGFSRHYIYACHLFRFARTCPGTPNTPGI